MRKLFVFFTFLLIVGLNKPVDLASVELSKYKNSLVNGPEVTDATKQSAVRNREFIKGILQLYLTGTKSVFEIGTGTADQTVYFCEQFPNVTWQTSDREVYHAVIIETISNAHLKNALNPVAFDIDTNDIAGEYDVVYASNVVHCIPWESTQQLFKKAASALNKEGYLVLYGPYNVVEASNIDGVYTSIGNKNFDLKLKSQDSRLGLRDVNSMTRLAQENGLVFVGKHYHVEANNYVLVFQKK